MNQQHQLKIGVSGIRGVVGEFFTPALACAFAQAFGTYVGRGRVVLGRDSRSSGEMLQHAVACGLLASGCDVVELGILPTPTIQIYAEAIRARGGIAITASHNPPEYNALKLFNARGLFLNRYERHELLDLYHQSDFNQAGNAAIGKVVSERVAPARLHIEKVVAQIDPGRIRRRKFRVALDAVNGSGSLMTPSFLSDTLGCQLEAISIDPSKPFPRIAEPRPDTLGDLADLVRRTGSEIGFGQDPDGDRLAVVDETGHVLDNDDMLALVLESALERRAGDVVVNLSTSAVVDWIAARHGRRVHRTPVGEANVVETMLATGAAAGGEGSSGGAIFPPVHLCRDSYIAMALLLDRMAATERLCRRLPPVYRGTLGVWGKLPAMRPISGPCFLCSKSAIRERESTAPTESNRVFRTAGCTCAPRTRSLSCDSPPRRSPKRHWPRSTTECLRSLGDRLLMRAVR